MKNIRNYELHSKQFLLGKIVAGIYFRQAKRKVHVRFFLEFTWEQWALNNCTVQVPILPRSVSYD